MSFRDHCRSQARACAGLGSPFTAWLLTLVAERLAPDTAVADRLLGWPPARIGPDALGLRLAGALHHLVLSGAAPMLARLYADPPASDSRAWRIIEAALRQHEGAILAMLDHPPQTNELRRSAVMIAVAHWLAARHDLPLVLSELGASAGLNLLWDHYALSIDGDRYGPEDAVLTLAPDWTGPPPPKSAPLIRARAGVDLNPLDPVTDRLRLRSYIWADQHDRHARTEAALDLAADKRPEVTRGCAIDWLEARLARPVPQAIHLVYHTVVWQYLPPEKQARGAALLARAGARVRHDEPLAHLSMEDDGTRPGAALRLHLWPENAVIDLGRADFHGRWIDWQAPAIRVPGR